MNRNKNLQKRNLTPPLVYGGATSNVNLETATLNIIDNSSRIFHLSIGDIDSEKDFRNIIAEIEKSAPTDKDHLVIDINSYGGNAEAAIGLCNNMVRLFGDSITTIISSTAYSAATFIFLIGSTRLVYETSSFMIHSYSSSVWGKEHEILSMMEHRKKRFRYLYEKWYSPFFSKDEIERLVKGEDIYLNAGEMLERGIATDMIKFSFHNSGCSAGAVNDNKNDNNKYSKQKSDVKSKDAKK